ncbi:MAG TPA: hypothetical protein VLS27_07840, partial [Gammaproteobacteria bacterium]|nr:hypothetical protein [Gammaproteobacteria bacterium]
MIPLVGILACLTVLAASMAALSAWRRRGGVSAETARKTLHVEMGLIAAGFPWIFDSAWQVLVLAALALAWFRAVKTWTPVSLRFGDALFDVRRKSRGEFYFIAGVVAAYLLSAHEPAYYCTAILVTALADTAAMVSGWGGGRHRFRMFGSRKSLEGSSTFFHIAFACTVAVLAVMTPVQSGSIVAAALVVATVTTLLEAGARNGADNLLIPVGALAGLHLAFELPVSVHAALFMASVATAVAAWAAYPRVRRTHVWSKRSA